LPGVAVCRATRIRITSINSYSKMILLIKLIPIVFESIIEEEIRSCSPKGGGPGVHSR
jgi:hypothetical protein